MLAFSRCRPFHPPRPVNVSRNFGARVKEMELRGSFRLSFLAAPSLLPPPSALFNVYQKSEQSQKLAPLCFSRGYIQLHARIQTKAVVERCGGFLKKCIRNHGIWSTQCFLSPTILLLPPWTSSVTTTTTTPPLPHGVSASPSSASLPATPASPTLASPAAAYSLLRGKSAS